MERVLLRDQKEVPSGKAALSALQGLSVLVPFIPSGPPEDLRRQAWPVTQPPPSCSCTPGCRPPTPTHSHMLSGFAAACPGAHKSYSLRPGQQEPVARVERDQLVY